MGKRSNALAARIRILQRTLDLHDVPRLGLQDLSITIHSFHCSLLEHAVHHASHAADLCRHQVPPSFRRWAKQLHRDAATERHEVFCNSAAFLDVPLPGFAMVVECSGLEARLSREVKALPLASFHWNANAPCFTPFARSGFQLERTPHALSSEPLDSSTLKATVPESSARISTPWCSPAFVDIQYDDFVFTLTDVPVSPEDHGDGPS